MRVNYYGRQRAELDGQMDVTRRIVCYSGRLILESEFYSGAIYGSEVTDNPLVRDTEGRIPLRGESMAGFIRREMVRYFGYKCKDFYGDDVRQLCSCEVCELMGYSRVLSGGDEGEGSGCIPHGSRLKVEGGTFEDDYVRIRHGVAIDRRFQTAAQHRKYDLEALLPGAFSRFLLEVDNPTEEEEAAIERILSEMREGLLAIGGKKGAGFGGFTVEYDKYIFDMGQRDDVIGYLSGEKVKNRAVYKEFVQDDCTDLIEKVGTFDRNGVFKPCRLAVPFDIWFPEMVLVDDPLEAALVGSDHASVVDRDGLPWLPPSSIRGVFRSRAEQIIRTLNPLASCDPSSDDLDSHLCSCSRRLEDRRMHLRGADGKEGDWPSVEELESGNLLCLCCSLFGSTYYGGKVYFRAGRYTKGGGKVTHQMLQHFLAIDRFTGGGKDGAKFDAIPLTDLLFSGCRIIIDAFEMWEVGLMALLFKDLMQADINIGLGSRRGFGRVAGSIGAEQEVVLSTPDTIYRCKVKDLYGGIAEGGSIRIFLERAVGRFRERVTGFKGVVS